MILPVARLATGFAAIATTMASKCTTNGCLRVAIGNVARAPPLLGTSVGVVPVLATETASLAFLQTLRGGASTSATSAILDLSRESLFVQGMATYATVSALIMNAALRMFTSTNFSNEQNTIVSNAFHATTALCILTGTFTTILFQLVTIYSKSALAMGNDEGFLAFKAATSAFRIWGFRCFLTEMMTFMVSFMSKLYNSLWDDARKRGSKSTLTTTGNLMLGGSVALLIIGTYLIQFVLHLASVHVYKTAIK